MDEPTFRSELLTRLAMAAGRLANKPVSFMRFEYVAANPQMARKQVEQHVHEAIPPSIAQLFLDIATKMDFVWFLESGELGISTEVDISCGMMQWDVMRIDRIIQNKRLYESDPEWLKEWRGLVPWMEIANGDMIAVPDETSGSPDRVFYLSPNDPDWCVVEFEQSLAEFLLVWAELACVNDVSLLQFRHPDTRKLSLDTPNARKWTAWLRHG